GLVNAHGHVGDTAGLEGNRYSAENVTRDLRLYASYGVTTVVSLGGDRAPAFAARDSQRTATLDRARIFVAGPVLAPATPDDAVVAALRKRSVCVCPTLMREVSTFVYESTPAFFSDPFFLKHADPSVVAALREPARQESMRKSASAQRYKTALEMAERNLKK